MGCGSSKDDTIKGIKGKKGKGKKSKNGKRPKSDPSSDDDDFQPITMVEHDTKPEQIRKEINKVYKLVTEKREKLKTQMRPFLAERRGIMAMLDEEKERLMSLLEEKTALENEKSAYMEITWTKDAEEVYRCFEAKDKPGLINILACRTRWQLEAIGKKYEEKFGGVMYMRLMTDGQKLLGKLFSSSLTNLSKLLVYRMMPQDERDASFLRDFTTKGMSIQDENILEVILTRTNRQLAAALDYHADEYGTPLREILSNHSYKNYREFIAKVLECNRDERNIAFDSETAQKYADELYAAGAGRTIGINAEPFIRILSVASKAQIDSIIEKYKNQALMKDIDTKLGGDFAMAVKIRCTDKYEYLASRIAGALKSFSKDKDLICRVLGSLSRLECVKLREAFDRSDFGRSLEASLKSALSGEPNFLKACLTLISGDLSQSPLGSDKELGEDEEDISRAGVRAREAAESAYNRQKVFEKGEQLRKESKANDDDEIPNFDYDARCKSSDVLVLNAALKEVENVKAELEGFKDMVKDDILSAKETYLAILSHCYETETWIGTLRSHVSNLKLFDSKREAAANSKK